MTVRLTRIHARRCSSCPARPFPPASATDPGFGSTAFIGRAQFHPSGTHPVSFGSRCMTTIMNQGRATVSEIKFSTWAPSRSLSDTARQSPTAHELTQLPPAPPYPCPFLTDEEIKHYLIPLYERGWTVQPSQTAKKPAPELVKRFEFESTSTSLKEFLEDINDVTEGENHHAALSTGSSPPSVTVRVHTHSGLRPAAHPDEPRKGRVQPGITLRDIRFAYLLEQRHANYPDSVVVNVPEQEQPTSAEAIETRRLA